MQESRRRLEAYLAGPNGVYSPMHPIYHQQGGSSTSPERNIGNHGEVKRKLGDSSIGPRGGPVSGRGGSSGSGMDWTWRHLQNVGPEGGRGPDGRMYPPKHVLDAIANHSQDRRRRDATRGGAGQGFQHGGPVRPRRNHNNGLMVPRHFGMPKCPPPRGLGGPNGSCGLAVPPFGGMPCRGSGGHDVGAGDGQGGGHSAHRTHVGGGPGGVGEGERFGPEGPGGANLWSPMRR
jgi:hypothetical protein